MTLGRLHRLLLCAAALAGLLLSASAKPYGLKSRDPLAPFLNGTLPETAPNISDDWSAVPAFPHLLFTNAVGLTHVPGSNLLAVWEREGRLWLFENSSNTTQKTLALDISNQCQGWDDSGLLGVAFHPGFATNHFVFIYYTWVAPGTVTGDAYTRPNPILPNTYHDRLERYTLDANGMAIPGSEKIFVDLTNQTVWHHGGGMFFHPTNGFLYWTDGDNAVGDNDQAINKSLYSGVFRVDVDCLGGNISHAPPRQPANGFTANYFIPNDNPFVGQPGALEEFFCLGLRSPHRMTIDPPTGRIFIGDVGESSREEIDVIEPGESALNFQWNKIEGKQGALTPPFIGKDRPPILDYPHSDGRAIIGGYVYRGKEFARDLGGKYIFGDNVYRTVWALDETTTPPQKNLLCVLPKGDGPNSGADYTGLSSFGTDADGEIYLCQMSSIGGRIYRLQRGGPPPPAHPLPALLSETSAFADLQNLSPAAGLIPYSVNSPLWSDGAIKARWLALPANTTIGFMANGEWKFPAGTVFIKTFSLPVDDTNPKILRRLETRILVRDTNNAVYGATYKWRADNSDADLVIAGTNELIAIKTAAGTRTQNWFFPGRQDCLTCHTPQSGGVLGVNTRQLNGDLKYPGGSTDNQLRALNHLGFFDTNLTDKVIAHLPKLVDIADNRAPLELRVRSYLDANCAQCHRPGGVQAFFDARFDTPLARQGILNGPVANPLGISGAKVVAPGNTNRSVLLKRILLLGENQMPPLARSTTDTNAAAILTRWIRTLPRNGTLLPAGWDNQDIGNVALPGEASFLDGRFNVIASGNDIWDKADAFHFVYRSLTGDGQIIAHVATLPFTDPWAKAGVMFRDDLSPGSRHVFMAATAEGRSAFQHRPESDGDSRNLSGPSAKRWLKLVRTGDIFTGYVSADGLGWEKVGDVTNILGTTLYVGLAVTSHNNAALNSTLFNHVTVADQAGLLSIRAAHPAWWTPVFATGAPAWEILPQAAGPGEVILSKRNELGLLSNFAATPFTFHGQRYASLEGFWQAMKFPESTNDIRATFPGLVWPYTRAEVTQLTGFDAKRAGSAAEANMRIMGIDWVTFEGRQLRYHEAGKGDFCQTIVAATREKVRQNPEVQKILVETGNLTLRPDHLQETNAPPAWRYYDILTAIRTELQENGRLLN